MFKTALFAAAAAIASLTTLAAAPAYAGEVKVSYKDLDLTTAAGQSKLARRIDAAARRVCNFDRTETGTRIPSREAVKCYQEAKQRSSGTMASIIEGARLGG